MRVVNYTSLPEGRLMELLHFAAKGSGHAGVELHIKNERTGGAPHGYCYWDIPGMANVAETTRCLITMHLPSTPESPDWWRKWMNGHGLKRLAKMYPHFPFESWEDGVVYLAAHEFRHWWQENRRVRRRRQGKPRQGKLEHDASKHGLTRLNAWRVHTGREPIAPVKQPNPFAKPQPIPQEAADAPESPVQEPVFCGRY